MNGSDNIVLFDGVCNLCNGIVRFIMRRDHDRKIRFAPIQSALGQSLYKKFELSSDNIDTVIYISSDKYYLRSSAVLHVLKDIGGVWRFFYGLIIIPRVIRDLFYDQVARSRYLIFGKRDTCMIPDTDIADRFLA
jgi:predicted DCC family thiol-disulfide oxidoreductase YuxK